MVVIWSAIEYLRIAESDARCDDPDDDLDEDRPDAEPEAGDGALAEDRVDAAVGLERVAEVPAERALPVVLELDVERVVEPVPLARSARWIVPGRGPLSAPPARSVDRDRRAAVKNRKNRNEIAKNTVGMINSRRRTR